MRRADEPLALEVMKTPELGKTSAVILEGREREKPGNDQASECGVEIEQSQS